MTRAHVDITGFEPATYSLADGISNPSDLQSAACASIAISLKRIADAVGHGDAMAALIKVATKP